MQVAGRGGNADSLDPPFLAVCRYKGLCKKRAEEAGIATARLPITKYVQLDSRAVLTVNHVVQVRGGKEG